MDFRRASTDFVSIFSDSDFGSDLDSIFGSDLMLSLVDSFTVSSWNLLFSLEPSPNFFKIFAYKVLQKDQYYNVAKINDYSTCIV